MVGASVRARDTWGKSLAVPLVQFEALGGIETGRANHLPGPPLGSLFHGRSPYVRSPPSAEALLRQAIGARAASRLRRLSLREVGALTVSELQKQYGLTSSAAEKAVAVLELAKMHATEALERGAVFRGSPRDLRSERRCSASERNSANPLRGAQGRVRTYSRRAGALGRCGSPPAAHFGRGLRAARRCLPEDQFRSVQSVHLVSKHRPRRA